jgi:hypothetical protein
MHSTGNGEVLLFGAARPSMVPSGSMPTSRSTLAASY